MLEAALAPILRPYLAKLKPPVLPGDTLRDVEASMEQLQPRAPYSNPVPSLQERYVAPVDGTDETGAEVDAVESHLRTEAGLSPTFCPE